MNIHEYQAKEILSRHGIPVPPGQVAASADKAEQIAGGMRAKKFAVKAQVHAGGRGKAGGVKLAATASAVRAVASELLGKILVTDQTGPDGRIVNQVYVEEAIDSARELYISVLIDPRSGQLAVLGSRAGGDDVEARIEQRPDLMERLLLDLAHADDRAAFLAFAGRLGLADSLADQAGELIANLVDAFIKLDASLIEINPLIATPDGRLMALDVKMVIDGNALSRHPELASLYDKDELDPVEFEAQRHELNFVRMKGNIGVVSNGAGLALATHDMLCDAGGRPANFMDIRTMATSLQIARGIGLLLDDPDVKVILVNVHGGGMTQCDTIAEAVGIAARRHKRKVPIVFRAAGNNAEFARTVMRNFGLPVDFADSMSAAVAKAVDIAGRRTS